MEHHDAIGQYAGQRDVVGDEEEGHSCVIAELAQQRHNLGLHQHVQGRGDLIGDEQARPGGDGERDGDALGLTARELMRICGERSLRVWDADTRQERGGLGTCGGAGQRQVRAQHFDQLRADRQERVEASRRILEHITDVASQLRRIARPAELARNPAPGRQEPSEGAGERGLTRAGLSNHRELLPDYDLKGEVGESGLLAAGVAHAQVTAGDEGRHHDPFRSPRTSVIASPTR